MTASQPRPRLLLVDDEAVLLQLLTTLFADQPYELVACSSGRQAIEAMEAGGVDLLLTDKNLPDVGGLELVARARAITPDCEAIMLTGYPSLDTALQAMQLDIFDYLVKPPRDIYDVQRKVHQAAEKQRVNRENRRLVADLQARNAELEATLDELRALQSELIQSEKLAGIGTLAAGVAHEIASPLFGVLGLAEAIVDESDVDTIHGHARDIIEYSRTIREIVGDLTGYSRLPAEGFAPEPLADIVADAVRLVLRTQGLDDDRVAVDVDAELAVPGRRNELQQVFVNLVKNAIEACGDKAAPPGAVRITGRREGEHAVIAVTDDGPGIPEDQLGALFDPFFTTKPPGQGTGLGLNIVWRIALRHQGTVSVRSVVGEGTTFTVRLPT